LKSHGAVLVIAFGLLGCSSSPNQGGATHVKFTDAGQPPDAGPAADAAPHEVVCGNGDASTPTAPLCTCKASGVAGQPTYSGGSCASSGMGALCCADAKYPDEGSCSCYGVWTPWACYSELSPATGPGAISCTCGYLKGQQVFGDPMSTTTCNITPNASDTNGMGRRCCSSLGGDGASAECGCIDTADSDLSCGGARAVTNCATPELAGIPVQTAPACTAGQHAIASCSSD